MILTSLESVVAGSSLEQRCEILREAGFSGIDILGHTLGERVKEVRSATAATGIRLVAVYARLGEHTLLDAGVHARAHTLDLLKERLETAGKLDAEAVIFVPIFGPSRMRADAERMVLLALLDELTAWSERSGTGVPLVLEPLNSRDTHLVYDPREAVEIVQAVGSPLLRTMVDTYHMDLQGLDMTEAIRATAPYMRLVHLSDTDRKLPGQGQIDFARVLSVLESVGYDGPLGLECNGNHDLEAMRRTAAYLRESRR